MGEINLPENFNGAIVWYTEGRKEKTLRYIDIPEVTREDLEKDKANNKAFAKLRKKA